MQSIDTKRYMVKNYSTIVKWDPISEKNIKNYTSM